MGIITKEMQENMSPRVAYDLLVDGNKRFVSNVTKRRDLLMLASETSTSQYPFAITLSCIDSRTSMELIFDQGIGHIFSARVAGNVVSEDMLGSIEFACKLAGSKLIVVLGHTSCGAIKGACDNTKLGNLTGLLEKIKPAVNAEKTVAKDRDSSNKDFVEKVTNINVSLTVKEILAQSPILKEMIDKGEVGIVGGVHDLATGEVHFHNDTMVLNEMS